MHATTKQTIALTIVERIHVRVDAPANCRLVMVTAAKSRRRDPGSENATRRMIKAFMIYFKSDFKTVPSLVSSL